MCRVQSHVELDPNNLDRGIIRPGLNTIVSNEFTSVSSVHAENAIVTH